MSNLNVLALSTALIFDGGTVDVDATIENARTDAEALKAVFDKGQESIVKAVDAALQAHPEEKKFSASTLASMAISLMGKLPNAANIAHATPSVAIYLDGQSDKFLRVGGGESKMKGPSVGYWVRSRCSEEQLTKLTETATKGA